jgi:Zn-dependent M16 (insulinase) family peptidase
MTSNTFTLIDKRRIESLRIEVQAFLHGATGARHFHLASDDDNNAFMVAFPTIPRDSTGVAHILEHTTLCGSERYPVRDPFFMMLRRSLNTFMNAFTSGDSTAYPFATRNRKDFDNLLGIYLDAVFFPRLDPLDFAQEGCRVEFASAGDPAQGLVFKGVVFNEMKGAMSSPIAQLWQHVQAALLPDTPYRFNSGGDPAAIPDLTYQQLRAFHARHYHPSQAVFLTYGTFPAVEHQQKFEALALSRFARSDEIVVSGLQPQFTAPSKLDVTYAAEDAADEDASTHVVWGWLLDEAAAPRKLLEAHLLQGVLLEHSASPLRHYLETTPYAKAPSELCGVDDSARQMIFLCGVEGTQPEHAEVLEGDIRRVLERVAAEGVSATALNAALDRIEMAQRDISGDHFPYGLQLMSRMLPGAMYRADPVALLDIDALLGTLRAEIADPAFFPRLLRAQLLDNPHWARVTMVPDAHKRAQEQAAERERLARLLESLSSAGRAELVTQAAALETRQAQRDDPEVLPKVTLADVPPTLPPVRGEQQSLAGRVVHTYRRGTNGIGHVHRICTVPDLDAEELRLLPLFAAYLLEFGAGRETYLETQARRSALGNFAASAIVRSHVHDLDRHHAQFVITGKGLRRHAPALTAELDAILDAVRFDETARLRDLLAQTRADLDLGITERGHQLAMHGAARGLSRGAWLADLWDGPSNVRDVQRIDDRADTEPASLAELLDVFERLRGKLLARPSQALIVGEAETLGTALDALGQCAAGRAGPSGPSLELPTVPRCAPTAWLANADVNFCAKAYPVVSEGHADAPALAVLGRYLSDGFLHPAIRERGGAYGSGASFDADNGCFVFYSYRDPRLGATIDDFDRAPGWFAANEDPARLEESILGVIRALDKPRSPAGAAIDAHYSAMQERTPEFRAAYRARVLATSYTDLCAVAERYLDPGRGVIGVVTHRGEQATIRALGLQEEAL